MRFIKRVMVVGALAGAVATGTAPSAAADVPCGLSTVYINGENRWGWNIRNCDNYGKWRAVLYDNGTLNGLIGTCNYVGPNSIITGSSRYHPIGHIICG